MAARPKTLWAAVSPVIIGSAMALEAEGFHLISAFAALSGAVFIQSNRKSIFLFSGLDGKGRERSAMFMIIDAYIRDHAHNHLVFDFDGSNDDDLARFYKGFGSTECTYLRVHKNNLPGIIKTIVKILKKIKA